MRSARRAGARRGKGGAGVPGHAVGAERGHREVGAAQARGAQQGAGGDGAGARVGTGERRGERGGAQAPAVLHARGPGHPDRRRPRDARRPKSEGEGRPLSGGGLLGDGHPKRGGPAPGPPRGRRRRRRRPRHKPRQRPGPRGRGQRRQRVAREAEEGARRRRLAEELEWQSGAALLPARPHRAAQDQEAAAVGGDAPGRHRPGQLLDGPAQAELRAARRVRPHRAKSRVRRPAKEILPGRGQREASVAGVLCQGAQGPDRSGQARGPRAQKGQADSSRSCRGRRRG
mmetsp:Transcript_46857/g.106055  ORF Transcript_46857/g.106055 Transcript_46857/m.106055 type:complete len:287 (+) Transcript_46857:284-1144(+)